MIPKIPEKDQNSESFFVTNKKRKYVLTLVFIDFFFFFGMVKEI